VDHDWPPGLAELPRLGPAIGTMVDHLRAAQVAWVEERLGRALVAGDLSPDVLDAAARAGRLERGAIGRASDEIQGGVAPIVDWWRTNDVLVTPTMRRPPWRLGREAGPVECGLFAAPFSFTGQPAFAAPLSTDADGMPVGIQLVVRRNDDELLLALGQALEDATGWAARRPPPQSTGHG